jgi:hypothetical protein
MIGCMLTASSFGARLAISLMAASRTGVTRKVGSSPHPGQGDLDPSRPVHAQAQTTGCSLAFTRHPDRRSAHDRS